LGLEPCDDNVDDPVALSPDNLDIGLSKADTLPHAKKSVVLSSVLLSELVLMFMSRHAIAILRFATPTNLF
jgi:hypothetical protein